MVASVEIFFFNDTATPEIYTLSLHDALPIWLPPVALGTVLTWVTMKSGAYPTPTRFPAAALLSSISSCTSEDRTSKLPTHFTPSCPLTHAIPLCVEHAPGFSHGPGGSELLHH